MDIEKIKSTPDKHRMSVHLTLRVSPDIKNWLVENNYSATAIFHEAIKELGYEKDVTLDVEDKAEFDEDNKVYYIKQRVKTRHGWRTKLVTQTKPKKYGKRKGNIQAQRKRRKIRSRRKH